MYNLVLPSQSTGIVGTPAAHRRGGALARKGVALTGHAGGEGIGGEHWLVPGGAHAGIHAGARVDAGAHAAGVLVPYLALSCQGTVKQSNSK